MILDVIDQKVMVEKFAIEAQTVLEGTKKLLNYIGEKDDAYKTFVAELKLLAPQFAESCTKVQDFINGIVTV